MDFGFYIELIMMYVVYTPTHCQELMKSVGWAW
jgi:hypothetical protein